MRYMGGKHRIAPMVAEYLLSLPRTATTRYIEPFCGSLWVATRVAPHFETVLLSDAHGDLISMWIALQNGWPPPTEATAEMHRNLRERRGNWHPALRAFVGFGCSFGGNFYGGFARGRVNYAEVAARGVSKKCATVSHALFAHCSFDRIPWRPERDDIVYCDPPYAGTCGFTGTPKWDAAKFWEWVRQCPAQVVVSEYTAPPDFEIVAKWTTTLRLRSKNGCEPRTERLFRWKGAA